MTNTKITKRENFAELRTIVEASEHARRDDLLAFIDHEVELLDNKRKSNKEPKGKVENEVLRSVVVSVLEEADKPMNMTELLADSRIGGFALESGKPVSTPKLSAVIAPLVRTGKIVKTLEKKTPFYSLGDADADAE
jgi:hypothetical protein